MLAPLRSPPVGPACESGHFQRCEEGMGGENVYIVIPANAGIQRLPTPSFKRRHRPRKTPPSPPRTPPANASTFRARTAHADPPRPARSSVRWKLSPGLRRDDDFKDCHLLKRHPSASWDPCWHLCGPRQSGRHVNLVISSAARRAWVAKTFTSSSRRMPGSSDFQRHRSSVDTAPEKHPHRRHELRLRMLRPSEHEQRMPIRLAQHAPAFDVRQRKRLTIALIHDHLRPA